MSLRAADASSNLLGRWGMRIGNGDGPGRPEEPKPVPFRGTQTLRAHFIMADPGHTRTRPLRP